MGKKKQKSGPVSVQIDGLDSLRAQLGELDDQVREGAADALEEAAQEVERDMMMNVPIEEGTLMASLGHEVDRENLTADVGTQGSGVHYGQFVEFGTSKMPAQPFAQPAAEVERANFPARLRRHLGEHLPDS